MRSFRTQMKVCTNSENLILINIEKYGYEIKQALVCLKNKEVCHSNLCKKERLKYDN